MSDTYHQQLLSTSMLQDKRFSGFTKPDIEKVAALLVIVGEKVFNEGMTPESLTEEERNNTLAAADIQPGEEEARAADIFKVFSSTLQKGND